MKITHDIDITLSDERYLSQLAELEHAIFERPYSRESLLSEYGLKHSTIVHALYRKKLIAYAIFHQLADEAELLRIAVSPELRQKGIAHALLARVIENCRKNGLCSLFLEVHEHNKAAIQFYKKNHFTQIAIRKGYYPDGAALVFKRSVNLPQEGMQVC